ncbi:Uncharacterised protein [BD1-7 clade bacterium]|nr:Uncharacterised protein [BD1-7 clade bacterium]
MQPKYMVRDAVIVICVMLLIGAIAWLGRAVKSIESLEQKLDYQEPSLSNAPITNDTDEVHYTYVPAYSHVYASGGKAHLLETTLSIRNTDPEHAMTLHSVQYFSTNGTMVREYLPNPVTLRPMASAEYLLRVRDTKGGSGANFVVLWSSARQNALPIIEAVMVATGNDKAISFTSRGILMPFTQFSAVLFRTRP